jgi:hypothetical protein
MLTVNLSKKFEVNYNQSTNSEFSYLNELDSIEVRRNHLEELKNILSNNNQIIPIRSFINLTKTESSYTDTFLYRDIDLESEVEEYLDLKNGFNEIIKRYNNYDKTVVWNEWPKHYAVRVLAGCGPISSGKNIFSFFPEALRLIPKSQNDVFGLEFIDAWENIFKNTIFPIIRKVFCLESQLEIFTKLETKLSRTIYLAAVFHEMGHRCGPWKISPHAQPNIKINSFNWGVMGEIATDSQLSIFLEEFPEIPLFVTLQRLFWFGRRGVSENPISGMTNLDNDSWLGSYLWNKLIENKAIIQNLNKKWTLNSTKLINSFKSILEEIDMLAQEITNEKFETQSGYQDNKIEQWMKSKVAWDLKLGFIIPKEFREMLSHDYDIPEQPYFYPPFSLNEFREHYLSSSLNLK